MDKATDRLTIAAVIPSYNRELPLARALQSVYAQSRIPDEVIVVDDGSEDGTASMMASEFPQADYLYQKNQGVSAARNAGIKASRSEWIALLDSDDEWLPNKLFDQEQALQRNSDYTVCHTEEIWIRNGRRVNPMRKHAKSGGWIFQQCLPLCAMSPSSIMIRRDCFDQVGYFDESLPACEDYDLWLRLASRVPVLFIEQALIVKYGGHEDQLSAKYWGMDRFRIKALQKILEQDVLKGEDRRAAIAMLKEKAKIFSQGALKRGKEEQARFYLDIVDKHYE